MKTTLIIMAAGIGYRFGTGIKQLAKMNNNGELIIDYSIYDAVAAGFNKVVFIIRKDIEAEFKEAIGNRIADQVEVSYVYQDIKDIPNGFSCPEDRVKPWGTGHAVLCAKDAVNEPFVIINADDYYGKDAFVSLHNYLLSEYKDGANSNLAMAGFVLKNTLSENGAVTRGLCVIDDSQMLQQVLETKGICYKEGMLTCNDEAVKSILTPDTKVSMNMWAGSPVLFEQLEQGFKEFLKGNINEGTEFLIPIYVDEMLKKSKTTVKVIETPDKWIGITYQEDKELAQESFKHMSKQGIYPSELWD